MILLDTHIWLRWLAPGETPLPAAMTLMLDQADDLAVSAVSCWEVAYLHKRGRLSLPSPLVSWLDAALGGSGIACIPVTGSIAAAAAGLADVHRDPADRFIIATALASNRRLLTLDAAITQHPELVGQLVTV